MTAPFPKDKTRDNLEGNAKELIHPGVLLEKAGPVLWRNVSNLPEPIDDPWAALGDSGATSSGESCSEVDQRDEENEPDLWAAIGEDGGTDTSGNEGDESSETTSENIDIKDSKDEAKDGSISEDTFIDAAVTSTSADSTTENVRWEDNELRELITGVNRALVMGMTTAVEGAAPRRWSAGAVHDPFALDPALLQSNRMGDVWGQVPGPRRWSEEPRRMSLKSHGLGMLFTPPDQAGSHPDRHEGLRQRSTVAVAIPQMARAASVADYSIRPQHARSNSLPSTGHDWSVSSPEPGRAPRPVDRGRLGEPDQPAIATKHKRHGRSRSVQFARAPVVTTTYGQTEYTRDAWEEKRITGRELSRIQTELDEFKLLEMDIHPESIQNTYLHKRYI